MIMGKRSDDEDTVGAPDEIVDRLDPLPNNLIETTQFMVGGQIEINQLTDDD